MTPLALAAIERDKERARQSARRAAERRRQAAARARAAEERRKAEAAQRRAEAAARRLTAEEERRRWRVEQAKRDPFVETVAVNIYRRRNGGPGRYIVHIDGRAATFDDFEKARRWRNEVAASRMASRPLLLVNLIRAGEAPGRL